MSLKDSQYREREKQTIFKKMRNYGTIFNMKLMFDTQIKQN